MTTLRPVKADTTPEDDQINTLREAMITKLRELNAIRTEAVEEAFRTVPRHQFMPEAPLEKAYAAEYAQITKKDDNGVSISSVSAEPYRALG